MRRIVPIHLLTSGGTVLHRVSAARGAAVVGSTSRPSRFGRAAGGAAVRRRRLPAVDLEDLAAPVLPAPLEELSDVPDVLATDSVCAAAACTLGALLGGAQGPLRLTGLTHGAARGAPFSEAVVVVCPQAVATAHAAGTVVAQAPPPPSHCRAEDDVAAVRRAVLAALRWAGATRPLSSLAKLLGPVVDPVPARAHACRLSALVDDVTASAACRGETATFHLRPVGGDGCGFVAAVLTADGSGGGPSVMVESERSPSGLAAFRDALEAALEAFGPDAVRSATAQPATAEFHRAARSGPAEERDVLEHCVRTECGPTAEVELFDIPAAAGPSQGGFVAVASYPCTPLPGASHPAADRIPLGYAAAAKLKAAHKGAIRMALREAYPSVFQAVAKRNAAFATPVDAPAPGDLSAALAVACDMNLTVASEAAPRARRLGRATAAPALADVARTVTEAVRVRSANGELPVAGSPPAAQQPHPAAATADPPTAGSGLLPALRAAAQRRVRDLFAAELSEQMLPAAPGGPAMVRVAVAGVTVAQASHPHALGALLRCYRALYCSALLNDKPPAEIAALAVDSSAGETADTAEELLELPEARGSLRREIHRVLGPAPPPPTAGPASRFGIQLPRRAAQRVAALEAACARGYGMQVAVEAAAGGEVKVTGRMGDGSEWPLVTVTAATATEGVRAAAEEVLATHFGIRPEPVAGPLLDIAPPASESADAVLAAFAALGKCTVRFESVGDGVARAVTLLHGPAGEPAQPAAVDGAEDPLGDGGDSPDGGGALLPAIRAAHAAITRDAEPLAAKAVYRTAAAAALRPLVRLADEELGLLGAAAPGAARLLQPLHASHISVLAAALTAGCHGRALGVRVVRRQGDAAWVGDAVLGPVAVDKPAAKITELGAEPGAQWVPLGCTALGRQKKAVINLVAARFIAIHFPAVLSLLHAAVDAGGQVGDAQAALDLARRGVLSPEELALSRQAEDAGLPSGPFVRPAPAKRRAAAPGPTGREERDRVSSRLREALDGVLGAEGRCVRVYTTRVPGGWLTLVCAVKIDRSGNVVLSDEVEIGQAAHKERSVSAARALYETLRTRAPEALAELSNHDSSFTDAVLQ